MPEFRIELDDRHAMVSEHADDGAVEDGIEQIELVGCFVLADRIAEGGERGGDRG